MQRQSSVERTFVAIAALFCLICLGVGCASTVTPQGSILDSSKDQQASIERSGFLRDYSQLKPGGKDRAALVYINPAAKWSNYKSVMVDPVQCWGSAASKVPVEDQQVLANYFYNALRENLRTRFNLVDQPGPGVIRVQAAITDATAATPVLRSVSVIVPQARVLNSAQSLATGSYAFAGSAQAEGQFVDSVTGERLAAAVDKREGGMAVQAAAQWKWGDAQNVLDYWAQRVSQRLLELQTQGKTVN